MSKNNNQSWQSWSKTSIIILIWFTIIIFFTSNVSAQVVNGDFSNGLSGWSPSPSNKWSVSGGQAVGYSNANCYLSQSIDLTGYDTLTFNASAIIVYDSYIRVRILNTGISKYITGGMKPYECDVSSFSGFYTLQLGVYPDASYSQGKFDDFILIEPPPNNSISFNPDVPISNQTQQYFNYTVNSTYEDYMYFVTSVWHAPYNLSDLYLIENWLNVEQVGENIQLNNPFSDLQTYHLNLYATTSAPPVVSESFLIASSNEIYINRSYTGSIPPIPDPEPDPDPYDPDPNPIEDPNTTIPDDWNMTIPDKYQNVSWLTNYTGYFDDLTYSINNTLYSVTGLVIKPMQSLNETVHILRYHISNSKNMVAEYSYLSVIVYYGWGVLPVEMQTIFIGVAAAGACIYLFKRRT